MIIVTVKNEAVWFDNTDMRQKDAHKMSNDVDHDYAAPFG